MSYLRNYNFYLQYIENYVKVRCCEKDGPLIQATRVMKHKILTKIKCIKNI